MHMLALKCRRNEVLFGNPGRAGRTPLWQEHLSSESMDKDPELQTIGVGGPSTVTIYKQEFFNEYQFSIPLMLSNRFMYAVC